MDKDNSKYNKSKNNKMILIKSILEDNERKNELNEKEIELKQRLIDIDNKLESIEKVVTVIGCDKPNTIFSSDAFQMLVESIAITAAIGVVAEYLDISIDDIEDILK